MGVKNNTCTHGRARWLAGTSTSEPLHACNDYGRRVERVLTEEEAYGFTPVADRAQLVSGVVLSSHIYHCENKGEEEELDRY